MIEIIKDKFILKYLCRRNNNIIYEYSKPYKFKN